MKKKIIVIGAGVGGLATAVRLQSQGYDVTIYEKFDRVGGKMNLIAGDGYNFDLGPTIVMMPEVYEDVFKFAGVNPKDYIPMEKIEPMYSLYYDDGDKLKVTTDYVEMNKMLEGISYNDAQGFYEYIAEIYRRYLVAKDDFIERSFRGPKDFYNPYTIKQTFKLKTFDSAYHTISKYLEDDKLRKMLSFQTLYIGISPYNGPSIYTIIPMVEMLYGVWFIKGGMYTMANAMERLFKELGGNVYLNSEVDEIIFKDKKAIGIRLNGKEIYADYIVCNADFPYAMKNLVKDKEVKGKYTDEKIDKMKYSCSCFLMYLGIDKKLDQMDCHNVFFAKDFDKNIEDIFTGTVPEDPSFYAYVPTKMDESLAPKGKESLYVLVPVPELSKSKENWDEEFVNEYKERILNIISNKINERDLKAHIEFEKLITPNDFKDKFNVYNSATFGLAPTLFQSNYYRPHNKYKYAENLYFAGSSVHPGAGVPMVLTSAKLACEEIIRDDKGE